MKREDWGDLLASVAVIALGVAGWLFILLEDVSALSRF